MYKRYYDVCLDWESIRHRMHTNRPPYLDSCDCRGAACMSLGSKMIQPIGNAWKILSRTMRRYNSGGTVDCDLMARMLGQDCTASSENHLPAVEKDYAHYSILHVFSTNGIRVQITYRGSCYKSRIHITEHGAWAYVKLLEQLDELIPSIENELSLMINETMRLSRIRERCMKYIESCIMKEFHGWEVVQMFHMYGIEPYKVCSNPDRAIYFHLDSNRGRHVLWAETNEDSFQMRVVPEKIEQQMPLYFDRLHRFLKNQEERRRIRDELHQEMIDFFKSIHTL